MCCGGSPDAPNLVPYSNIAKEQAGAALDLSQEQQDWARNLWQQQETLMNEVLSTQTQIMGVQLQNALEDRARYVQNIRPMEDAFFADVNKYNDPAMQEAEAGKFGAAAKSAADAERENALRSLESYGIDPSQTRSQALDASARMKAAANEAGAMNMGRALAEEKGLNMRNQALAYGQGLQGMANQGFGMAGSQGAGAVGTQNAAIGTGAGILGTGMGWQNQALSANNAAANMLLGQHSAEMAADSAEGTLGGFGQLAGTLGGAGIMAAMGAEDGGHVTQNAVISPEKQVNPPGPTDTVPTMLAPGEYVIPAEVVRRKGIDFFDNLVKKTQESNKVTAPKGVPEVRGMQGGGTVYDVSAPAAPAINTAGAGITQGVQMPSYSSGGEGGGGGGMGGLAGMAALAGLMGKKPGGDFIGRMEEAGLGIENLGNQMGAPIGEGTVGKFFSANMFGGDNNLNLLD